MLSTGNQVKLLDFKVGHENKVKRWMEDILWIWGEKRLNSKTLRILETFQNSVPGKQP